jgi:hypothetical protein
MTLRERFKEGWNGHAVVITVLTVIGLAIAFGAWFYPKSPNEPPAGTSDRSTSASTATGAAPHAPTTTGSSERNKIRYLSDMTPVTGGAFISGGGPDGRHGLVIRCASGQSNDRSREVSWNVPGTYSTLLGRVNISGKMDPEQNVQLEWFADGARIYNNSTLTLDSDTQFNGELAGAHDVSLRLTCASSAGVATLLDAGVQH